MSFHLMTSSQHFSEKSVIGIDVFHVRNRGSERQRKCPRFPQPARAAALVGRHTTSREPLKDADKQVL